MFIEERLKIGLGIDLFHNGSYSYSITQVNSHLVKERNEKNLILPTEVVVIPTPLPNALSFPIDTNIERDGISKQPQLHHWPRVILSIYAVSYSRNILGDSD